jgi:RNA polymerase sigma-70 factor (sigma-B/F/G subfamily)
MTSLPSPEQDRRSSETMHLLTQAVDSSRSERERLHNQVILLNLPLAESIARRYVGRGESLEDLVQVASLALAKAVRRFDPSRGHDFASFAVPTIAGEIKRHFRDNGWMIRPPRRIQELQQQIPPAVEQLSQLLRRAPRPSELSAHLQAHLGDVCEALATNGCYSPASLDDRGTDDRGEPSAALGRDDPGLQRAEAIAVLTPLCKGLSRRDQQLLYLRFFRGWNQSEIAAELGVSQMQISRLLSSLLTRMRAQGELPVSSSGDYPRDSGAA